MREYLPELIDLIWNREIDPGKVYDVESRSKTRPPATARWIGARDQVLLRP